MENLILRFYFYILHSPSSHSLTHFFVLFIFILFWLFNFWTHFRIPSMNIHALIRFYTFSCNVHRNANPKSFTQYRDLGFSLLFSYTQWHELLAWLNIDDHVSTENNSRYDVPCDHFSLFWFLDLFISTTCVIIFIKKKTG